MVPDILRAQKAVPFIKWHSKENISIECKYLCEFGMKGEPLPQTVKAFLSAPLKPEDIPKLFEGKQGPITECEINWVTPENVAIYGKLEEFQWYPWAYLKTAQFTDDTLNTIAPGTLKDVIRTAPKTLNDFISDCNRAGITLTWKS